MCPFFTNAGRMMPPIQRVNVDFAGEAAEELNISRQAVIKTLVRQALDPALHGAGGARQFEAQITTAPPFANGRAKGWATRRGKRT